MILYNVDSKCDQNHIHRQRIKYLHSCIMSHVKAVLDPGLRGGGGGGHPDPEIRGGSLPPIFLPLWASVWSKNKGGQVPCAPPRSATEKCVEYFTDFGRLLFEEQPQEPFAGC